MHFRLTKVRVALKWNRRGHRIPLLTSHARQPGGSNVCFLTFQQARNFACSRIATAISPCHGHAKHKESVDLVLLALYTSMQPARAMEIRTLQIHGERDVLVIDSEDQYTLPRHLNAGQRRQPTGASEQPAAHHTVQHGSGERRKDRFPWHLGAQGIRRPPHHHGLPENHAYGPVPRLRLTPSSVG